MVRFPLRQFSLRAGNISEQANTLFSVTFGLAIGLGRGGGRVRQRRPKFAPKPLHERPPVFVRDLVIFASNIGGAFYETMSYSFRRLFDFRLFGLPPGRRLPTSACASLRDVRGPCGFV